MSQKYKFEDFFTEDTKLRLEHMEDILTERIAEFPIYNASEKEWEEHRELIDHLLYLKANKVEVSHLFLKEVKENEDE